MSTQTAFRHIEKALRDRLGIREARAREIVSNRAIVSAFDTISVDMRGCVAIVDDANRLVAIHARDAEGVLSPVEDLIVEERDLKRWREMPVMLAYGLPDGTRVKAA